MSFIFSDMQTLTAATTIQTAYRSYKATQERYQEVAVTIIQSLCRGRQAHLMLKQLQPTSQSIIVIDAKNSGLNWQEVSTAIEAIADKELKDDEGWVRASAYVQEDYFSGASIDPGLSCPEAILLAKIGKEIIGFIITAKREENEDDPWSLPSNTGYVAYLAVDSKFKRYGIGTKLMLAAMDKTKQIGKRYLTLEYIAEGKGVDIKRGKTKTRFYNSFSSRFGIPMKEKGNVMVSYKLHVHPYYDLQNVDFSLIKQSDILI